MKQEIECKTTEDASAAIAAGDYPVISGNICLSVSVDCRIICKSGQPHVEARESSQPHVEAWGSSQPHVVARESSQPHVVAWESSQPHVVAWGSSQPHVVARGCCQLSVRGNIKVQATAMVAVIAFGLLPEIDGAGFVSRVDLSDAASWCEYYGVETDATGCALLFKALDDDFCANYNRFPYVPGTAPVAPDWDGGYKECGGGLHFSPSPMLALAFFPSAVRFCACRVALNEIVTHPDGVSPEKVKAPRVLEVFEVDRHGKRI